MLLAALWCPGSAIAAEPDAPDSMLNDPSRFVGVKLRGEVGFLAPLSHRLQLGSGGTYVDVRKQLGQDNLYFFARLSGDLDLGRKRQHTVSLLWQPLNLRSSATLARDIVVEDTTVPADTPVDFRYGFSFWRLSYLYDFLEDEREVAIGAALQIRNANLEYTTKDGQVLRAVRDVGPVPLLKFRGWGYVARSFWMGGEVDGFYAPIRYINGGRSDVEGAILDTSLKFGVSLNRGIDPFLSLRYLFGGAQGTSSKREAFSDGFTKNWLHFMTVSVGVTFR